VATAGTDLVGRPKINPTAIRLAAPLTSLALTTLLCGAVFRALAGESLRWRAAWAGAAVSAVILNITPTAAGCHLRLVAGRTRVELFLVLAGVLITCYLAAFGLLLGPGRRRACAARQAAARLIPLPPTEPRKESALHGLVRKPRRPLATERATMHRAWWGSRPSFSPQARISALGPGSGSTGSSQPEARGANRLRADCTRLSGDSGPAPALPNLAPAAGNETLVPQAK
jgi:hypothetical protein